MTHFPLPCYSHSSHSLGPVSVAMLMESLKKAPWIRCHLNYSKLEHLVKIKVDTQEKAGLLGYIESLNASTVSSSTIYIYILNAQNSDVLHDQSAIDKTVSCRVRFFLQFLSTQKRMTDNSGDGESKIHLWIWESCCSPPLSPCPHFHSLFLPNQFCAGTLLTQVKGLWSSSQWLCLHSGGGAGDTQGVGSISAPLLLGSGDRCLNVLLLCILK